MTDAALIVIDSDAELARARALVDELMASDNLADLARLQAQARLIAAYEEGKWPRRPASTAEVIKYLMDQQPVKQGAGKDHKCLALNVRRGAPGDADDADEKSNKKKGI